MFYFLQISNWIQRLDQNEVLFVWKDNRWLCAFIRRHGWFSSFLMLAAAGAQCIDPLISWAAKRRSPVILFRWVFPSHVCSNVTQHRAFLATVPLPCSPVTSPCHLPNTHVWQALSSSQRLPPSDLHMLLVCFPPVCSLLHVQGLERPGTEQAPSEDLLTELINCMHLKGLRQQKPCRLSGCEDPPIRGRKGRLQWGRGCAGSHVRPGPPGPAGVTGDHWSPCV